MDPLSIITSTITIAGLLRVTIGKARNIKNGQTNIEALANESSALMIVLLDIEKAMVPNETTTSLQSPELHQKFNNRRNRLRHLVERLSVWVGDSGTILAKSETIALRRLRVAGKHRDFCNEMILLRHDLCTILTGISVCSSSRLTHDIQDLRLASEDAGLRQQEFFAEMARDHDAQLEQLTILSEQLSLVGNSTGRMSTMLPTATEANYESNERQTVNNKTDRQVQAFPHNGSILFDSKQMAAVTAVGIRTAQFNRSACKSWCSCRCHNVKQWSTIEGLGDYIGYFHMGFSGIPRLRLKCDSYDCQLASQPMACAMYFFPSWFLDRAISLMMSSTPMAGPVVSLKTYRTVPSDASLFTYAKLGEVEKIKSLFERQLASPHDVCYRSGVTALHLGINYQQIDVCRFLLQANADPFLEDRSRWAPSDGVWTKILFQSFEPDAESQLRDMFTDTECLERRGLTILHRIVLGLVGLDLETYLKATSADDIDSIDVSGRTAVMMAAGRGDCCAVKLLLQYGANPNLTSPGEGSPLHVAAIARDGSCLQLLLQQHADIRMTTNYKQSALHYVAAYKDDGERAEALLDAGADLDARDLDGITPLQWAVVADKGRVVDVLIKHSANLCNTDKYGRTAFLQAITANRHAIRDLILKSRIQISELQGTIRSLLHNISESADAKTMELLRPSIGPAISTSTEEDVAIAVEAMAQRSDVSHALSMALAALLEMRNIPPNDETDAQTDSTKLGEDVSLNGSPVEPTSCGKEKGRMPGQNPAYARKNNLIITNFGTGSLFSLTIFHRIFTTRKDWKRRFLVSLAMFGLLYLIISKNNLSFGQ